VFNSIDNYVADGVDAVENGMRQALEKQYNDGKPLEKFDKRHHQLKAMNDDLHKLLQSCFDRSIDKFELYALRNVLLLPEKARKKLEAPDGSVLHKNVLLKGVLDSLDEAETPEALRETETQLQSEVAGLRKRLRQGEAAIAGLERDKKRLADAKREIDQFGRDAKVAVQSLENERHQGGPARARTMVEMAEELQKLANEAEGILSAPSRVADKFEYEELSNDPADIFSRYDDVRADYGTNDG